MQYLSAKTLISQETWDIIEKMKVSQTCVDCEDEVAEDMGQIDHVPYEETRMLCPSRAILKTIDLSGLPLSLSLHFLNL